MKGYRPLGKGALALLLVIPVLLGAFAGGITGYMARTPGTPTGPAAATDTYHLQTHDYYFLGVGGTIDSVKNPRLNASVGDTVVITITDAVNMTHNLYVEGYNVQSADVSSVGMSTTISFVANQQGTFAYYCAIPGHRALGMEGTLVVGTGAGGANSLPPIGPEVQPVNDIVRDPSDVPPAITRTTPATVQIWLNATDVNGEIEPGVSYTYWTYNGKVPGPFFRVLVNDTVVVHFHNSPEATMNHSIDFHAVMGPGGGAGSATNPVLRAPPGGYANLTFKALWPGLFVYHCATPDISAHIANGMFGMILVQPDTPLPPVDKEFYVMQSEMYTKWPIHTSGNQLFDDEKLLDLTPTYFVFNGAYQGATGKHQLTGEVNQTIRIYFGDIGPNFNSAFHVIGEILARVWQYGSLSNPPLYNVQTVLVPAGGTVVTDLVLRYPGNYILVDHDLTHAVDLGALGILNVTGWTNSTVFNPGP